MMAREMTQLDKDILQANFEAFGCVPVNDEDETEIDFEMVHMGNIYEWSAGTDRFDVLKWFDDVSENGLVKDLMPHLL